MPCNHEPQFGRCPILLSSPSNKNTMSINHAFMTYIEHQDSVDLPCRQDIHRTLNTVSIYHGRTPNTVSTPTMHSHPIGRDVSCINAMEMSLHAISCLHVRSVSHATYLLHYMSSVMDNYIYYIYLFPFLSHIYHIISHIHHVIQFTAITYISLY